MRLAHHVILMNFFSPFWLQENRCSELYKADIRTVQAGLGTEY